MRMSLPPRIQEFHERMAEIITPNNSQSWILDKLAEKPLDELLFLYLNWADRFVVQCEPFDGVSHLNRQGILCKNQINIKPIIATAETFSRTTLRAFIILKTMRDVDKKLDDSTYGASIFYENNLTPPPVMEFEWLMNGCDLYLAENESGVDFNLANWQH